MCGIIGLVGRCTSNVLSRMNNVLAHRGPDGQGMYADEEAGVGLAMRRLSILDLPGGRQPMSNEDGSIWIVFNGEIYNAPQLRSQLEARGHTFKTSHSDTEVLLHLYEEQQEEMLGELNGMFGFLIYDQRQRRLFGARDRLGIKPFYYLDQPDLFACSSELKALLVLPECQRQLDFSSLYHYMSLLYVPGERTIFASCRRLPPGHSLTLDLDTRQLRLARYWRPMFPAEGSRSIDDWSSAIREGLRGAVARWTLSDVPIACSLSGGIDSSLLVALLRQVTSGSIRTYSLGFAKPDEQEWDELPLAREVARRWETEHHELILTPQDLLRDLVRMVWHLDEPYGGGLPSWYVFEFMSRDVKVGLTGSGGDELFGSYGKFRRFEAGLIPALARVASRQPRAAANVAGVLSRLAGLVPTNWPGRTTREHLRYFPAVCREPARWLYFDHWYYFSDDVKRRMVFQDGCDETLDTGAFIQALYEASGTRGPRDAIVYVDLATQLPEEFLFMTDRFSMAHSLEARVPYLDHTFVELVLSIPASVRTRRDDPKYLLKRAGSGLIPPALLGAPKRGFVLPVRLWLRQELKPLVERLLGPQRLSEQGIFRTDFYDRFVRPHIEGSADFTWQVWAALMFQLWHVLFLEDKACEAPTYTWEDIAR